MRPSATNPSGETLFNEQFVKAGGHSLLQFAEELVGVEVWEFDLRVFQSPTGRELAVGLAGGSN